MKKGAQKKSVQPSFLVDFDYGDTRYQIDTERRKVYRKWIEVESARTYLIMSAWSNLNNNKTL